MKIQRKSEEGRGGRVMSVRGSVVDAVFSEQNPPHINNVLLAGERGQIVIEVLAQSYGGHVRGVALTPTEGLARGASIKDTGAPLTAPVGHAILSRVFDVFGRPIDRGEPLTGVEWEIIHKPPPRFPSALPGHSFLKPGSR